VFKLITDVATERRVNEDGDCRSACDKWWMRNAHSCRQRRL